MKSFNLPPGCTLDDIDPIDREAEQERRERIEEERADRQRDDEMLSQNETNE